VIQLGPRRNTHKRTLHCSRSTTHRPYKQRKRKERQGRARHGKARQDGVKRGTATQDQHTAATQRSKNRQQQVAQQHRRQQNIVAFDTRRRLELTATRRKKASKQGRKEARQKPRVRPTINYSLSIHHYPGIHSPSTSTVHCPHRPSAFVCACRRGRVSLSTLTSTVSE